MCRSSSPLFGDQVFWRCFRDGFEQWIRLASAFRQEGMDSEVIMSADETAHKKSSVLQSRYWKVELQGDVAKHLGIKRAKSLARALQCHPGSSAS